MAESTINTEIPAEEQIKLDVDLSAEISTPVEVKMVSDLFKDLHIDDQIRTDIGPNETIDVIPDFRPVILQLVDHVSKIYQQISQLCIPQITPATLLASCLESIYLYGTMADIWHVREYTSYYGVEILDNPAISQNVYLGGYNPVPPFLRDILRAYEYTFDPRRKNLAYIYSFASFDFNTDYGRCFPIHMFIALHNLIVEADADDTPNSIWQKWLNYIVISDATTEIKVAHIIGGGYANHTVDNYLTVALKKLLSPLSILGRLQRKKLAPFEFDQIALTINVQNVNAYTYLLSAQDEMLPMIMNFKNMMRQCWLQLFSKVTRVFELFQANSGTQIMNHYYTTMSLPTYHNLDVAFDKPTTSTLANYAIALNWKCTWRCETESSNQVKVPDPSTIVPKLYLGQNSEEKPLDPDIYKSFNENEDLENYIVYQPWSTGKSSSYYPLTAGLCIESQEIDGFGVPIPRNDTSIHDENSIFLNSAIPLYSVHNRTTLTNEVQHSIRSRSKEKRYHTKISMASRDFTRHILPYYPRDVACASTDTPLPGFTSETGITKISQATTKIAFKGTDVTTAANIESAFGLKFHAWSSYRWQDRTKALKPEFRNSTYMLMNFRTMYGTLPATLMIDPLPTIIEHH